MSIASNDATLVAMENSATKTYLIYYTANLLTNAFLLSFYSVLVVVDHPECVYSRNGTDIAE